MIDSQLTAPRHTPSPLAGELKDAYGLRQDQLELIAAAANAGGYFSIAAGFLYDALLPFKKVGPRLTLGIGLVVNAAGYVGLWAALTG